MIIVNDVDLDNILLDKKSNENILIYHPAHKTPYGAKPLPIILDNHERIFDAVR